MSRMALDKQIHVHSVDTGHFYTEKEKALQDKYIELRKKKSEIYHNHLKKIEKDFEKWVRNCVVEKSDTEYKKYLDKKSGKKHLEKEEFLESYFNKELYKFQNQYTVNHSKFTTKDIILDDFDQVALEYGINDLLLSENIDDQYHYWFTLRSYFSAYANLYKQELLNLLNKTVEDNIRYTENGQLDNVKVRCFYEKDLNATNTVSLFESFLSRTIGAKTNEFCDDLLILQVYYFDIFKDLCFHGMDYCDNDGVMTRYRYFTSSAGQIRTKKAVFIKEDTWNKYEKTLMCGLTIDKINENGGNNINKHLAYMALTNSATDLWVDFDIDKTIVVDDFETMVTGEFDSIDDVTYEIEQTTDSVPIPHMDGCGMVLPSLLKINSMIRIPWIKGLISPFNYVELIKEQGWSPKIKDIYGQEHDVIAEDIQIIFTKSQFKMNGFYDDWDSYKEYFKKYNCTAGLCNQEEKYIKNATINYQMLQTLTDISDDEIKLLASKSNEKLQTLCDSVDNVQKVFGITPYNTNLTPFQASLKLYPSLLRDPYSRDTLRDLKNSMLKKYRSGKLDIYGKYTFIVPDLYAACEYYFGGIENPTGLLQDHEVYCRLFKKTDKLDCLRSPHLYKEHAVRNNLACIEKYGDRQKEISKWFDTNALYTSTHDLISRILQFDVDGDKSLVIADKTFVEIAERNMTTIVPLYYEMKKAQKQQITKESIYDGLVHAFTGSNIGIYSNNISVIWNDNVFSSDEKEQKIAKDEGKTTQDAMNVIKLLCMENNFVIDYAKTLYKPIRPKHIAKLISKYTQHKLPHFFVYAKDKTEDQVESSNNTFVNKLYSTITDVSINLKNLKLPRLDYTQLMFNSDTDITSQSALEIIELYDQLNKEYKYQFNIVDNKVANIGAVKKKLLKQFEDKNPLLFYVTDVLVKFLYSKKRKRKQLLWFLFGEYIENNIRRHQDQPSIKYVECENCGELFEVPVKNNRSKRCKRCQAVLDKEKTKKRVQKYREKTTM